MAAVTELAATVGTRAACLALWVPRGSYYRDRRSAPSRIRTAPRPSSVRALAAAERETILAYLHHERFQDRSPAAVYATLLDEGQYHCSIRTMYRLLAAQGESRERRDHLTHPPYRKPELLAAAPNQLKLGHHQIFRSREVDLLLPLRNSLFRKLLSPPYLFDARFPLLETKGSSLDGKWGSSSSSEKTDALHWSSHTGSGFR